MKKNIAFLFDKKNFWIKDYLNFFNFKKYSKKYSIKCFKNENLVQEYLKFYHKDSNFTQSENESSSTFLQ